MLKGKVARINVISEPTQGKYFSTNKKGDPGAAFLVWL
jgi:hypothetical protein